jgi:8-oxo-dGTP pyrophosphatase MutT (NUDIX family)
VEALAREIKEETGLSIEGLPPLVGVGQMVNPTAIQRDEGEIPLAGGSALVLAYKVTSFFGALDTSADPDGDINEAAWHPRDMAVSLLAEHPFPFVRSVARIALALDSADQVPIAQCYFRRNDNGDDAPLLLQ